MAALTSRRRGFADTALIERNLSPQVLDLCGLHGGHRTGLGRSQQLQGCFQRAGFALCLSRREQAADATGGLGRECHSAFEKGSRRSEASACLRPGGGMFQFLGELLVGSDSSSYEPPTTRQPIPPTGTVSP